MLILALISTFTKKVQYKGKAVELESLMDR